MNVAEKAGDKSSYVRYNTDFLFVHLLSKIVFGVGGGGYKSSRSSYRLVRALFSIIYFLLFTSTIYD